MAIPSAAASAPAEGRLLWRLASVVGVRDETPHARTLVLDVPEWPGHRPGQHVDVRLVAEDGYEAQRSYSIASATDDARIELTIERLDDGEVSPYLCDVLHAGDKLELRGPIGGYFVWTIAHGGPLVLIGGGSGIVPLMAMLRHRARAESAGGTPVPVRLLYSARAWEDVIYRDELRALGQRPGVGVSFTLTRNAPAGWSGHRRRVDRAMLGEIVWPSSDTPLVYVCGPTPFTESVATLLVDLGHQPSRIFTERFGPTG
ncbi:MAG TPA: ferredoxin reductase [Gemmatimonadaceae bacterium]|nr:ferredoxin reductase [Gemmatimonadaceae bacterium]